MKDYIVTLTDKREQEIQAESYREEQNGRTEFLDSPGKVVGWFLTREVIGVHEDKKYGMAE